MNNTFIRPGVIEGFSGPMASGKSGHLLKRVDPLRWIPGAEYIGFKPTVDNREKHCRSLANFIDWIYVNEPREVLDYVKGNHDLVAIDASHLFANSTTYIGLRKDKYLRGYVYEFIELFAPHLTREIIEQAVKLKDESEVNELFNSLSLPLF